MTACPEHWQEWSVGEMSAEEDLIIGNGTEPRVADPERFPPRPMSVVLRGLRRYPAALNDGEPALA